MQPSFFEFLSKVTKLNHVYLEKIQISQQILLLYSLHKFKSKLKKNIYLDYELKIDQIWRNLILQISQKDMIITKLNNESEHIFTDLNQLVYSVNHLSEFNANQKNVTENDLKIVQKILLDALFLYKQKIPNSEQFQALNIKQLLRICQCCCLSIHPSLDFQKDFLFYKQVFMYTSFLKDAINQISSKCIIQNQKFIQLNKSNYEQPDIDSQNEILEREECMALLYSIKSYLFFRQAQMKFIEIQNKKNSLKFPSISEVINKEYQQISSIYEYI